MAAFGVRGVGIAVFELRSVFRYYGSEVFH